MDREYNGRKYSTKEFAELFNVSKHTLFFYEKIGLFMPAGRDNNRYRYYTASQIMIFDIILTLKTIGIPLENIMDYISSESPERLISIFQVEKKKIDRKISELKHIRSSLSIQTDLLIDSYNKDEGFTEIRYFLKTNILETANTSISPDVDNEEKWSQLYSSLAESSSKSDMLNQGSRILLSDIINGRFSRVNSIFIKKDGNTDSEIPEGLYGVIYTRKDYEDFDSVYKSLLEMMEKEDYKPVSDAYEEYVIPDIPKKNNWSSITRIRIKAEKRTRE